MQHKQLPFKNFGWVWGLAAALFLAANPGFAGTMARPTPPDPLLNPAPGPCAQVAAGPEYAAGTDAMGNPVIPADVGTPPAPVPDQIAVPLTHKAPQGTATSTTQAGANAYVSLDGKKLAPLLNRPGCFPAGH